MKKDVALVLSSGGPRGIAYIGAIEELLARGYNIHSVAGTSMGSLVGGVFAAGKLQEFKEWITSLSGWSVFSLMDLSLSKNHFVKGDKIIEAIKKVVPDVDIESLDIHTKLWLQTFAQVKRWSLRVENSLRLSVRLYLSRHSSAQCSME